MDRVGPGQKPTLFRATRALSRALLAPWFRLETGGVTGLPSGGPFVLLPKHQRWVDIPLLALTVPCPLTYVAKAELFRSPPIGRFLQALGGIPLDRERPMRSRRALSSVLRSLEQGGGLVIFPEGTYYRDALGPGRLGMIRFVLRRFSLPFVPVGIHYLREGVRTRVRVLFGNPLYPGRRAPLDEVVGEIMKEIGRLSGFSG